MDDEKIIENAIHTFKSISSRLLKDLLFLLSIFILIYGLSCSKNSSPNINFMIFGNQLKIPELPFYFVLSGVILALIFSCFSHLNKAFFLIRFIDNESKKLINNLVIPDKPIHVEKRIEISFTQIISPLTDHFLNDLILSGSDRIPKLRRIYWLNGSLILFLTTLTAFILLHFNDFKVNLTSISYTILSMICLIGISFWMFYLQVKKKAAFEQRKNEKIKLGSQLYKKIKEMFDGLNKISTPNNKNYFKNILNKLQEFDNQNFQLNWAEKNLISELEKVQFLSSQIIKDEKIKNKIINNANAIAHQKSEINKTGKIKSGTAFRQLDKNDRKMFESDIESIENIVAIFKGNNSFPKDFISKYSNLEKKSQYQLLKTYFGEITEQSNEE